MGKSFRDKRNKWKDNDGGRDYFEKGKKSKSRKFKFDDKRNKGYQDYDDDF